ncbi:MAG: hypothetical protein ACRYG8_43125 [Janthinobacterium lividum]
MTGSYKRALAAITGQHSPDMTRMVDALGLQSRGANPPLFVQPPDQSGVPPVAYAAPSQPPVKVFDGGLVATQLVLARILGHLAAQEANPSGWLDSEVSIVGDAVDHLRDAAGAPLEATASEAVHISLAALFGVVKAGIDNPS